MPPFIYRLRDAENGENYTFPKPKDMEIIYQVEQPRQLFFLGGMKKKKDHKIASYLQDEHYHGSLNINYISRLDYSLPAIAKGSLGVIDRPTAILWEIMSVFNLFTSLKKISSNKPELIKKTEKIYQHIFSDKTKRNYVETNAELVIFLTSEIEVDEIVAAQIILNELPGYFDKISVDGTLVLQIFGIKTRIMFDLVYLLTSFFQSAYLIKPETVSNIYQESYIVLSGLVKKSSLNFNLNTTGGYPYSLHLEPNNLFKSVIQCMNNELLGFETKQESVTRNYLQQKIYEGNTDQDYIEAQANNARLWTATFSNPDLIKKVLDDQLSTSTSLCASHLSMSFDGAEHMTI
jgi:hypothetical protein